MQTEKRSDICFTGKFDQPVEKVSLKDIESIKKMNGKFVQIEGILHYSFEDIALYPSKSAEITEAIWLDLRVPETIPEIELEKLYGRKITVIGKVNTSKKGHLNGYIAELDSAFCIKMK